MRFSKQNILQLLISFAQDEEEQELSEGYWREFFLLRPDKATLQQLLNDLSPDDLLHLQVREGACLDPFYLTSH